MRNYKVTVKTVEGEDNSTAWVAEFPAFPGCCGAGDTADEAVRDAFNNLEYHIKAMEKESLKIPAEDGDFRYSGHFQVRISPRLHETVAEIAEANGMSMNAYIAEAVAWYSGQNVLKKKLGKI